MRKALLESKIMEVTASVCGSLIFPVQSFYQDFWNVSFSGFDFLTKTINLCILLLLPRRMPSFCPEKNHFKWMDESYMSKIKKLANTLRYASKSKNKCWLNCNCCSFLAIQVNHLCNGYNKAIWRERYQTGLIAVPRVGASYQHLWKIFRCQAFETISRIHLSILASAELYGSVKHLPAAILAHLHQKQNHEMRNYFTVAIFPLSALKAKL